MALTPVLSRQQTQKYCENNYLLVSGLIPDSIAERAEAAMWRWMGLQPDTILRIVGECAAPRRLVKIMTYLLSIRHNS